MISGGRGVVPTRSVNRPSRCATSAATSPTSILPAAIDADDKPLSDATAPPTGHATGQHSQFWQPARWPAGRPRAASRPHSALTTPVWTRCMPRQDVRRPSGDERSRAEAARRYGRPLPAAPVDGSSRSGATDRLRTSRRRIRMMPCRGERVGSWAHDAMRSDQCGSDGHDVAEDAAAATARLTRRGLPLQRS